MRRAQRRHHGSRARRRSSCARRGCLAGARGAAFRPSRMSRAKPRICSSRPATIGRFAPNAIRMWNSSSSLRNSCSSCASAARRWRIRASRKMVDVLDRHLAACALDRDLLERLADAQDLVAVREGEPAHHELPARPDLEQSLGPEELEGLPDGCLRDSELVRDGCLGEHRPHREVTVEDAVADVLVRLVGEARPPSVVPQRRLDPDHGPVLRGGPPRCLGGLRRPRATSRTWARHRA